MVQDSCCSSSHMSRFLLARGRRKRKNKTPFQFKETQRIYDTFCWPKFNWKRGWKIQSLLRVAVCPVKTRRLYYLQKEETEFEGENSCHRRSIQDLMMHWTWGMRVAGVEVSGFFYQVSGCSCHSLKLDLKSPISHHSSLFPFPHSLQIQILDLLNYQSSKIHERCRYVRPEAHTIWGAHSRRVNTKSQIQN